MEKNKLDFSKMTPEEFLKVAFTEAARQEIVELEAMDIEAMDIEVSHPTEAQRKEIEDLIAKMKTE